MNKFLSEIKKANNSMSNTVIIDIDGVLVDFENCPNRGICDYSKYPDDISTLRRSECKLMPGAHKHLSMIHDLGLKIVLFTSRTEEEREVTVAWLKKHDIPYDDLIMNKPRGFIIIDDLAHRFISWEIAFDLIEDIMMFNRQ